MKFVSLAVLLFILGCMPCMAQYRPEGLLTDLLAHTDRVFINGYPSSILLQDLEKTMETVQYAEVRSSRPSFSWMVPGTASGTFQTSYRIIVAATYKDALSRTGTIWDSKQIKSKQSIGVIYPGEPLLPNQTYFWKVRLTTNTSGETDWSEIKAFRTAPKLETYASSSEQLRKTAERPVSLNVIDKDIQVVDFGKDAFGQLKLQVFSATGKDTIKIHLGEVLSGQRIDRRPGGTIRYQDFSLALEKGTHIYRIKIRKDVRNTGPAAIKMPEFIGEVMPFRYVEIEGYSRPFKTDELCREFVHYPFDDSASSFKSNDERLNQIWELCKYSMKATSFAGVYVDGDRERIPYEADALINQLGHYGVDREYSLARKSSEYLLEHPTWPTEWILQSLIISWNDYLYTGDARSLAANYQLLKDRTLTALRENNGLISTTTGLQTADFARSIHFKDKIRDIVDWPLAETDGFIFSTYNAVINAYHYKALVLMEQIAGTLHQAADASFYKSQHQTFKYIYNKYFFNNLKGIYHDGDSAKHSSLHTNMFALHFGLVPENHKDKVLEFIKSRGMACSVYGSQFLMDALYDGAEGNAALDLLTSTGDRSWYNMIRAGSTITLEAWDNKFKPNQDWNHAWGAAPANIIPRRLMGVEPLKAGFEEVSIRPQTGSLAAAEVVVPTIRGNIKVSVQKAERYVLTFSIPANMEALVYLPAGEASGKLIHNGKVAAYKREKGNQFLFAGKVPSGKHEFILTQ